MLVLAVYLARPSLDTNHSMALDGRYPARQLTREAAAIDTVPEQVLVEMRTSLRRVVGLEEAYFRQHKSYGTDLDLAAAAADNVRLRLTWAGPRGWVAEAIEQAHPQVSCIMYVGWIPEGAWPVTRRNKRTATSGSAACDQDASAAKSGLTWHAYATKLVAEALTRVASFQHGFSQANGTYTTQADSVTTKYAGNELKLTVAWASRDSWGAVARLASSPSVACVMWEGPSQKPMHDLKLPSGRAAAASGTVQCEESESN
jgi:hypothetical protein